MIVLRLFDSVRRFHGSSKQTGEVTNAHQAVALGKVVVAVSNVQWEGALDGSNSVLVPQKDWTPETLGIIFSKLMRNATFSERLQRGAIRRADQTFSIGGILRTIGSDAAPQTKRDTTKT